MKRKRKLVRKGLQILLALVALSIIFRVIIGLSLKKDPVDPTPDEEALRARALKLHHDALVFDGHNDVSTWILDFGFELGMRGDEPDDRSPFLDAQFFSIWVDFSFYDTGAPGQSTQRALDTRSRMTLKPCAVFMIWGYDI